jgi:hypothetical protein
MLAALIKRHELKAHHDEFMLAQLTSYNVNFSMCHPKKPTAPRDFMPSEWAKTSQRVKPKRLTNKRRAEIVSAFRGWFPVVKK